LPTDESAAAVDDDGLVPLQLAGGEFLLVRENRRAGMVGVEDGVGEFAALVARWGVGFDLF
jgi:hypothetical protein